MIIDNWGRPINYLRVAVTDRCNLRCFYCMPEEGISYIPKQDLLTYEELMRLISIFSNEGIDKVRITGGEPFVRKDLMSFISEINQSTQIKSIHLTTNGVLTHQYLDSFQEAGIKSVNLSLDTIDRNNFKLITRRDELNNVLKTLHGLIDRDIKTKINMVVMDGKNTSDIIPMIELAQKYPIDVRLIEEMPFNGGAAHYDQLVWNHEQILGHIKHSYPDIEMIQSAPNSTAREYEINGFKGRVGIIPAYSRTFCDSCNRIRLTAQGTIRTCLYAGGGLDFRELLRSDATDAEISNSFKALLNRRAKDGFEAEKNRVVDSDISESMSSIGG